MQLKRYIYLLLLLVGTSSFKYTQPVNNFKKAAFTIGGIGLAIALSVYTYKKITNYKKSNPNKNNLLSQACNKTCQAFMATKNVCTIFLKELLEELSTEQNNNQNQNKLTEPQEIPACCICLEEYSNTKQPVILPCEHNLCAECTQKHFFTSEQNQLYFNPTKTCPICRSNNIDEQNLCEQIINC